MRYDDNSVIGNEGETAVDLIVKRSLKWIFRRVTGPDFGIDGIVEQVRGSEAIGRWISLQIKSGDSYFRESGPDGVIFRDRKDHLDYYRAHQLPVVLVLHYPGTDDAIWQWISPPANDWMAGAKQSLGDQGRLRVPLVNECSCELETRRLGRHRRGTVPGSIHQRSQVLANNEHFKPLRSSRSRAKLLAGFLQPCERPADGAAGVRRVCRASRACVQRRNVSV
ncbi:DUF4365 domain-containing protein [Rhizobium ruizarguesonis]|nr:DUF4365 domain-containing protein [Rhizobium leguminosarum]TBD43293.1 DUF4365 domain-containing protein [Rhizobium ruizarguesonis]